MSLKIPFVDVFLLLCG